MILFKLAHFAGEAQPDVCEGGGDRQYAGATDFILFYMFFNYI
jgi:hypothetical protein